MVRGRTIKRVWFLDNAARLIGLDLYVVAHRERPAAMQASILLLCDDDPGHAGNVLDHIRALTGHSRHASSASIRGSAIAVRVLISMSSTPW